MLGFSKQIDTGQFNTLRIEMVSEEAYQTSAIEGEILNRDSLQSSIRKQFGLPHEIDVAQCQPHAARENPSEGTEAELYIIGSYSSRISGDISGTCSACVMLQDSGSQHAAQKSGS